MSKVTIASIAAEINNLARVLGEKPVSTKTSIKRDVLLARLADMRERAAASTDTVTLVELCREMNANAKSVRARFRDLYKDPAVELPVPVSKHTFRRIDVPAISKYVY